MKPAAQLKNWVKIQHEGQLIKRTEEPYFNHLLAVAEMAKPAVLWGYEIGLCHDLLEETATTANELLNALCSFGYEENQARQIASCVIELTDVFTAADYPELSKKKRKKREAVRLAFISPAAQTVKYADLIYNIAWMLKYDQKHAKKYLKKKELLITDLVRGDEGLRGQVVDAIHQGMSQI